MAYFARLENDMVLEVRVVEPSFMAQNPDRYAGVWVETFLDGDDVKLMAAPGFSYDSETGYFSPPQPFISWTFDETKWGWVAPVAYPEDGETYTWNEETGAWEKIPNA